jgi:hypothetical protein
MLRLQGPELLGVDHVRHRAAGVPGRQQHGLVGGEDLGRFGHEVDAAKDDHLRVGLRRLDAQLQGVADEIGNVLHLADLVVVGDDHRPAFPLQLLNPVNQFHLLPPR